MADKKLGKKAFGYRFEIEGVVVAKDEKEAEAVFSAHLSEILRDEGDHVIVPFLDEIATEADIPGMWDRECIPYGNDDGVQNARVKHYLEPA